VTLTRVSELLLPNSDPRVGEMSVLSDRIGNPRPAQGMLLYLVSVVLVAAAIIVLFNVAFISLLDTSKETLTGSRIDNSPIEEKFIDTIVSYTNSDAVPVPAQTKSPSSSEANDLQSSTPVPLPSGMPREETLAEPAVICHLKERRAPRQSRPLTARRGVRLPTRRRRPSKVGRKE